MNVVTRVRAAVTAFLRPRAGALSPVDSERGWITLRSEHGAHWQSDTHISDDNIFGNVPVYSCVTLITSDVGKVGLRLMEPKDGVWIETRSSAFTPVLKKPNHYQTRQQFIESWTISKLLRGNAYVLKIRDARQIVTAMYVLDPDRVQPLVAPDGSVFYALQEDPLSLLPVAYPAVPASEIIHDRMECPHHPLVGVSPLTAAYLPAAQGLRIQNNSEGFFRNMSRPSGILTAPGKIDNETANRLDIEWNKNYGGGNLGRTAVLGSDLKYQAITITAVDAQLVEQLKLSSEQICAAFHVPAYMIGVGPTPAYNNIQALNQQYYSQCLQKLYNAIEDLLDDGLGLWSAGYRSEFNLEDLLRMDSTGQADFVSKLVGAGVMTPNEGRARFALLPVEGGEDCYLQQQYWGLGQLSERTSAPDGKMPTAAPAPTPAAPAEDEQKAAREVGRLLATFTRGLEHV
ncbi:MAG TPA: phage portal protein [Burkholderiaceae bacterium]|nr:phage portal protein [Burkholderiaceae bacterium]